MVEKEKLVAMVEGLKRGDEDAATELFTTFHSDIYFYIFKIVNDRDLAEDLTQDTFMDILQNIHKLQEPAAFVTWSRQVAYFRCTGHFRKRKELLADEDEDGYSVFDTLEEERTEFIPDAALDQEDFKKTIQEMIDKLPQEQRAALLMRYYEELSVADIAKIQGVSEGTVKSRLNYGRKAVRQSVEEYEKKNGIKLRTVAIVPVLLWLLKGAPMAKAAAGAGTAAAATVGTVVAGEATKEVAKEGGKKIAKRAVKTGAKKLLKTTASKVAAGVAAAALVVGGGAAILQDDAPAPQLWVGYGNLKSYDEYRYELTVDTLNDQSVSGALEITYSYDGVFDSEFTGVVNEEKSKPDRIAYTVTFEEPFVWKYFGDFTAYDTVLYHDLTHNVLEFDKYPFEASLQPHKKTEVLHKNLVYTGVGEDWLSGSYKTRKDNHFTVKIDSISENAAKGHLRVYRVDAQGVETTVHESAFTGQGYMLDSQVILELKLDTPRILEKYHQRCVWMRFDTHSMEMELIGNHSEDNYKTGYKVLLSREE